MNSGDAFNATAHKPGDCLAWESRLAMWQAEHVQFALHKLYPSCDVKILGMTTRGDQILDRTLSKVGGKGLFVKDSKPHSPMAARISPCIPSKTCRWNSPKASRSARSSNAAIRSMPSSRRGYASLAELPVGRRGGNLPACAAKPCCACIFLTSRYARCAANLDTRLAKLDRGDYAGIILAAAGLQRLGLEARIRSSLSAEDSLPAAGQGALGIEISRRPCRSRRVASAAAS